MKNGRRGVRPAFTERIPEMSSQPAASSQAEPAGEPEVPAVLAPPPPKPGAAARPMTPSMWGAVPNFHCANCGQDTFDPEVAKQHRC